MSTTRRLDFDTCRCQGWLCRQRELCQRYIDRDYLGSRTGVADFLSEPGEFETCKYKINAKEYNGNN